MALGTVELADLVDSQLTEIADWELNLKMLKVQLPSSTPKKSDCHAHLVACGACSICHAACICFLFNAPCIWCTFLTRF